MATDTKQNSDDMAELRANIDRLTKDVASLSNSLGGILKSRTGEAAGQISEKTKESKEAVEQTIRERPFQCLLAAFGVGLLIGQLFRKRGSD